jgi:hypothetical protein
MRITAQAEDMFIDKLIKDSSLDFILEICGKNMSVIGTIL